MSNFYLKKDQVFENTDFWKQNSEADYVKCIQDLIRKKPFGDHKFYIFSFIKRICDVTGQKKMYHQPRLTRPDPLPGTTLIKVDPKVPESAIIVWTLPNQENFGLYKEGKMFADEFVYECIDRFLKNPNSMIKPDPEDLSDNQIREIYKGIRNGIKAKKAGEFATGKFATKI